MNYVCRLCLKETTTYIKINQKDRTGVTTRSLITALVPELYLGVSINPLVCKNCYLYLRQAYSFRLQCLRSENLIGIFIRETKNTNSIIMLEDVVDFWKKDYKEKGKEAEGNWEEWFGNMEGSGSEDVTAVGSFRHQKQEDGDIQKKRTVSELDLEKEKTADCTTACPDNEDDSSCNSIKSQEGKEKTGIERPIAADDDLILVENAAAEFSVPETETIKSIDKTSPVQTYTEKCNTLKVTKNTEATTEDELVKDTDRQESTNGKTTQVELIDDLNDEDISNLLDELQKGENLKKLGFPTPHTDGREKYVLKKFIDKSDNRLSFAFLPEASSADEDELETDSYVDEEDPLQENVAKDPEDAQMKDNIVDAMKTKLNRLVTVKQKSMELTTIRDARGRKRKLEESIDDTSVELCPNRRVNEESKNNFEEVNADSDKSEGFVLSPLVDDRESENGFVMVPCDPERPPDPLPSTSQDKPSANPRPIIRVRPVSALQKIRTLNHELWPQTQASGNVKDALERSHSSPKPSSDTPPVPYGLPPIVLNTQLEFPKPNTVIEKTNPQPPLTSANPAILKTVRRTIPAPTVMHSLPTSNKLATPKTYHRKATGGPRILKRVNPLTFKTLEEMQKLGLIKVMLPSDEPQTESTQLSVLNESLLKSSRDSLRNYGDSRENPGDHPGNSGDSLGISRDGLESFGDGMRASRDERNDEVIDIKQEPLSSIGNDVLMNCGTEDHSTESEGESTRSASETSIMDSFIAQSELVKTIVDSIPEVGEEMYDVPEYVHINKVTFSDLAKLVGESKIHRENVEKAQMQSNAESPKSHLPVRFKSHITKITPNDQAPKLASFQYQNSTYTTQIGVEPPTKGNKGARSRSRRGKRLRMVQVDADGREVDNAVPGIRGTVNRVSVLRTNVEITPHPPKKPNTDDGRNICVLYTSFTNKGDYINDHDYLISPYGRNNLFYYQGSDAVCVCLLCNLIHHAWYHIEHMKSHKTVCRVCRIDFHNVFILNLHVKCHSTYCFECQLTVTYADYIAHARQHNKSVVLSNIDIPDELLDDDLHKPAYRSKKEKVSPPDGGCVKTLAQLLNEPIRERHYDSDKTASSQSVLRRSGRLSRSRTQDDCNVDNEEACVDNKTTPPTAEKQQKLLEKYSSDKQEIYSDGEDKETDTNPDGRIISPEKESASNKTTEATENITIGMLLCDETVTDKTEVEILNTNLFLTTETSKLPGPVESDNVAIQKSNITKSERKKTGETNRKKRKRLFTQIKKRAKPNVAIQQSIITESEREKTGKTNRKKRKRLFSQIKQRGKHLILPKKSTFKESKQTESKNVESHKSFKLDLPKTDADCVEIDDVKTSENDKESFVSGNSIELNDDSSSTDKLGVSNPDQKVLPVRRMAYNKTSGLGELGKITYCLSSNKEIDVNGTDVDINSSVDEEGEPTTTSTDQPELSAVADCTEKKTNETIVGHIEHSKEHFPTTQEDPKSVKAGRDTASEKNSTIQRRYRMLPKMPSSEPQERTKLPESPEKKFPLQGDLKMRIQSIKYSPFVSFPDVLKEAPKILRAIPETKPKPYVKTYGASRKKKSADNPAVAVHSSSAENESGTSTAPAVDINPPDVLNASVEIANKKDKTEKNAKDTNDADSKRTRNDEKNVMKSDVLTSSTKARSSRSRGSLGLVEGLKGNKRRPGYRTPKKSTHSDSSGNLDTSQSKNEARNEYCQLKKDETNVAAKSSLETSRPKNFSANDSSPIKNDKELSKSSGSS